MFKKMRITMVISLIIISIIFVTAGCGKTNSSQPTAPADQKFVMKFGHNIAVGSIQDQAVNKFKQIVEQKSNGRIEVQVFPAAQLGNERDLIEGIGLGTVDAALSTTAYLSNIVPEMGMLDLPFVFRDYDHVKAVLNGNVGKTLADKLLKQKSIRLLAWYNSGFRVMLTTDKPIQSLADFKGLKMRAPEVPVYIDMFKALGANPTPIPFGDVYTSLQTGVVQGVEVAPDLMYSMKFHEVGKYIVVTNHIFSTIAPIISEKYFQSLPADLQKVVQDAATESANWEWDAFIKSNDDSMKKMEAAGVKVNDIDRQPLIDAVKPMWDQYATKLNTQELLAQMIK